MHHVPYKGFSTRRYAVICPRNHGFGVTQITVAPIENTGPGGLKGIRVYFGRHFEGRILWEKFTTDTDVM